MRDPRRRLLPEIRLAMAAVAVTLLAELLAGAGQVRLVVCGRRRSRRGQGGEIRTQRTDVIVRQLRGERLHDRILPLARAEEYQLPLDEVARLTGDRWRAGQRLRTMTGEARLRNSGDRGLVRGRRDPAGRNRQPGGACAGDEESAECDCQGRTARAARNPRR